MIVQHAEDGADMSSPKLYYLVEVDTTGGESTKKRDEAVMEHLTETDFHRAKVIRVPVAAVRPDLLEELRYA
jgi:hypothetical protein